MKLPAFSIVIGTLTTILFFQNCGPSIRVAEFDAASSGLPLSAPLFGNISQNPYQCVAGTDPGAASMRRLTLREYTNTINDLMAGQVTTAELQTELSSIPREAVLDVPATRLFDTTNPRSINLQILTAYHRIASRIADLSVVSTAKINAVSGDACMSAASVTDTCINGFLDRFGLRAYRRPLSAAEKGKYLALHRSGNSPADGMARVIHGLLMAPQFLYQITDNGTPIGGRSDLLQYSSYEMASRLSYMLMGTMPDAALFTAAANGSLSTVAGISAQADRIFATARGREMIREFYSQWLRLNLLADKTVTANFAGGINGSALQAEARQEIIDFMDDVIWNQRGGYQALLSSNLIYPKGPNLAQVYGVSQSQNAVQSSDPNRRGLFTRVGMLSQSTGQETSPIKRGIKMRVNILCDPIAAPASALLQQSVTPDPLTSTRTQVTTKTGAANCTSCHNQFNPLGFAFENFDAFGRYRTTETVTANGQSANWPIDAKVDPYLHGPNEATIDGVPDLQTRLALSNKGPACVARQYLQFTLGRAMEARDYCSLASMYDNLNKAGGSFQDMFKSLAQTPSFLQKKLN